METTYNVRSYQKEIIEQILSHWATYKRVLLQVPTGGGKTVIFATIARELASRNYPVLVLVHREELLLQAVEKLIAIIGGEVGIIKHGYKPNYSALIQVATVQTLVKRLDLFKFVNFSLIIIDEAHHSTASTYRKILDAYPKAYQLGVTATPIRLDGTGFRDLFEVLVCGPSTKELIKLGHLSKFRLFADPNPMKTKGVKTVNGDYSPSDMVKANDIIELSGNLLKSYQEHAFFKRGVVFACSVQHSTEIANRYNEAGIPAAHLDGKSAPGYRAEILERFRLGEIKVISNCQLFDEGLDIPALEVIQVAKPTKSLTRWLQMVGRALRPAENKDYAIILDHTKNWAIHGLPSEERIWSLDGVVNVPKSASKKPQTTLKESLQEEITEQDIDLSEINEDTIKDLNNASLNILMNTPSQVESKKTITPLPKEINDLHNINDNLTVDEWFEVYDDLIATLQDNDYKIGWLYYRLEEIQPPLEIWQEFGRLRGYHSKWAIHQVFKQIEKLNCLNRKKQDLTSLTKVSNDATLLIKCFDLAENLELYELCDVILESLAREEES